MLENALINSGSCQKQSLSISSTQQAKGLNIGFGIDVGREAEKML